MGKGLGPRQLEILSWLQEQWAAGEKPQHRALIEHFINDKIKLWHWDHDARKRLQSSWNGKDPLVTLSDPLIITDPERPALTSHAEAEAYRRALRTLIDRKLVLVTRDKSGWSSYSDPDADDPGEVLDRWRQPAVSKAEQRRRVVLQAMPEDGSWLLVPDLLDAFWLHSGGAQEDIDKARKDWHPMKCQLGLSDGYELRKYRCYSWLLTVLQQLVKSDAVVIGVRKRDWESNGQRTEQIVDRETWSGYSPDAVRKRCATGCDTHKCATVKAVSVAQTA